MESKEQKAQKALLKLQKDMLKKYMKVMRSKYAAPLFKQNG